MDGQGRSGGAPSGAHAGGTGSGVRSPEYGEEYLIVPDDAVKLVAGAPIKRVMEVTHTRITMAVNPEHGMWPHSRRIFFSGSLLARTEAKRAVKAIVMGPAFNARAEEFSNRFRDSKHNRGSSLHRFIDLGEVELLRTTLFELAQQGHARAAALANYPDGEGVTPLMVAASKEGGSRLSMCKVLLRYGADVGAVTNLGFTAFDFAASSSDNPDVVKLLAGRMTAEQIDARDKKGTSALDFAEVAGFRRTMLAILMAGNRHGKGPRRRANVNVGALLMPTEASP